MRARDRKKIFSIAGKALKKKDQWISYNMETVIEGVSLHLRKLGLVCIRGSRTDTLYFKGGDWEGSILTQFSTFTNFLGQGTATIVLEGPQIAASYRVRPSVLAIGLTLSSLGFAAFLIGIQTNSNLTFRAIFLSLQGFLVFAIIFFGLALFFIHRGMKKELINAFRTAEKIIESRARNYDTSLVEPNHLKMEPQNLARSAYYYRDQGMREKGRCYFALLLELYPWTEEASAAFYELRKG